MADTFKPQKDPPEGSREVIERELKRTGKEQPRRDEKKADDDKKQ
jgi:hypothetical protein